MISTDKNQVEDAFFIIPKLKLAFYLHPEFTKSIINITALDFECKAVMSLYIMCLFKKFRNNSY